MTEKELRKEFLNGINVCIKYWNELENISTEHKLYGLAHSILTLIDGCSSLNNFKDYELSYNGKVINKNTELHTEL